VRQQEQEKNMIVFLVYPTVKQTSRILLEKHLGQTMLQTTVTI
jgi:hypothetical protein